MKKQIRGLKEEDLTLLKCNILSTRLIKQLIEYALSCEVIFKGKARS